MIGEKFHVETLWGVLPRVDRYGEWRVIAFPIQKPLYVERSPPRRAFPQ